MGWNAGQETTRIAGNINNSVNFITSQKSFDDLLVYTSTRRIENRNIFAITSVGNKLVNGHTSIPRNERGSVDMVQLGIVLGILNRRFHNIHTVDMSMRKCVSYTDTNGTCATTDIKYCQRFARRRDLTTQPNDTIVQELTSSTIRLEKGSRLYTECKGFQTFQLKCLMNIGSSIDQSRNGIHWWRTGRGTPILEENSSSMFVLWVQCKDLNHLAHLIF